MNRRTLRPMIIQNREDLLAYSYQELAEFIRNETEHLVSRN